MKKKELIVSLVDVKRRTTHTMIYQDDQKIRVDAKDLANIGGKISRIQWRPFTERPKDYARYLCMSHIDGGLCYVERVCLYDKERDRWLYESNEIDVHCWLDMRFLPEVPDFDKQIIESNLLTTRSREDKKEER